MIIEFRKTPWDLVIAITYTLAVAGVLSFLGVGSLLALAAVSLVPGYILLAVLYPRNGDVSWPSRIILSLTLSVAILSLIGLLLNYTPLGVSRVWTSIALSFFVGGLGWLGIRRRLALPVSDRLSLTLELKPLPHELLAGPNKTMAATILVGGLVGIGLIGYLVVTPGPRELFTEFYVTDVNGGTQNYPTALDVSQPGTVVVGIANHELSAINYSVRVDLVGLISRTNTTTGEKEVTEANRTTIAWLNASIGAGGRWSDSYTFSIDSTGYWEVEFRLYLNESFGEPYRKLQLFVTVSPP